MLEIDNLCMKKFVMSGPERWFATFFLSEWENYVEGEDFAHCDCPVTHQQ
jgi:hypothetical protein